MILLKNTMYTKRIILKNDLIQKGLYTIKRLLKLINLFSEKFKILSILPT